MELALWLLATEDELMVAKVAELMAQSGYWWDSLPQDHRDRLNKGIADLNEGRVFTHEAAMERLQKWIRR